jgi:hypothetical protein
VKQAGGTRQCTGQKRIDSKEEKFGGGKKPIKNRNKATSLSGMSVIK